MTVNRQITDLEKSKFIASDDPGTDSTVRVSGTLTATTDFGIYATPTIANVSLTTADTEVSYALPADTKKFIIQNRNLGLLKISYILGESGSTYFTIFPGDKWEDDYLDGSLTNIYIQSPSATQTVEIRSWA